MASSIFRLSVLGVIAATFFQPLGCSQSQQGSQPRSSESGGEPGAAVGGDGGRPGEEGTGGDKKGSGGDERGGGPGTGGSEVGAAGGSEKGDSGGASSGGQESGGSGGDPFVVMVCEEGTESCQCDADGCLFVDGGPCVRGTDCVHGACENTQDGASVCCAESCGAGEVCSDDGAACETERACDGGFRCNDDFERCEEGQWVLEESCDGLGCSLDQGGCLFAAGEACTSDKDCGEGTCQEAASGGRICCAANCGDCKQCAAEGKSCSALVDTRPGCQCDQTDKSNCVDGIACTDDLCVDGACENPVSSGYCLISGQCVSHNTPQPNNPCRYCDSVLQKTGWSNSSSATSCDDSLYCNGQDTCNGAGSCAHQFPSSNRCSNSGLCALSTCDEQRDSCVKAARTECSSEMATRCENTQCGGRIQTQTIRGYCDGQSASCADIEPGNWTTLEVCDSNEVCNPQSLSCVETLGCGDTWCDPDTNLCWMTRAAPTKMHQDDAVEYCDDLDLAGKSTWRLPTANELGAVSRGCNGVTGTVEDASYRSTCRVNSAGINFIDCSACTDSQGPAGGCYWPQEFGACPVSEEAHWSTSTSSSFPGTFFYYNFRRSNMNFNSPDAAEYSVRCVTAR